MEQTRTEKYTLRALLGWDPLNKQQTLPAKHSDAPSSQAQFGPQPHDAHLSKQRPSKLVTQSSRVILQASHLLPNSLAGRGELRTWCRWPLLQLSLFVVECADKTLLPGATSAPVRFTEGFSCVLVVPMLPQQLTPTAPKHGVTGRFVREAASTPGLA